MLKNMVKGLFLFVSMFSFTSMVNAEEVVVTDETSLRNCVQTTNNVCKLNEDVTLNQKSAISISNGNNIIIDLNGKTITEKNLGLTGGIIIVGENSQLVMNDSSNGKGGVITTTSWAALQVDANSKLTVNGGNYTGYWYALAGNGTRHNTDITINDGTFKVIANSEAPGIYHPQNGTLTINGGYIEGTLGIEIRSGKLVVNGGTIVGTAAPTSVTPNGNGTTTEGAGIAVAQHTTKLNLNVEINGGTIKGFSALYQSNPQNNDQSAIDKVSLSITRGNFEAINGGTTVIYSENIKNFISGGTFNTDVTEYLADTYKLEENNGIYTVVENKNLEATNPETGETVADLETEEGLPNDYKLNVEEETFTESEESVIITATKDLLSTNLQLNKQNIKDMGILATYDISVLDGNDQVVKMENGNYKISVKVDETLLAKYKFFKVVYIDENGNVVESFDAILNGNMITFVTSHLSTYSIIGYNTEAIVTDNNSNHEEVSNPETSDNIILYLLLGFISLCFMVYALILAKKEA